MKALRFDRLGSLDALKAVETPSPEPGTDEVRVRVVAAGLNPSDVKNVLGRFPYTTLPRTPGRDFAGVIEKGPPGSVGREVWGTGKELGFLRDGSHAEFLVLPADGVATRPKNLSFAQCAASGVPYTTALDAHVVAAVRRPEQADGLRSRGVATITLADPAHFGDAVHAQFPEGADVVFDTTGAWLESAVYGLAPFGRIAVIAAPPGDHVRVPVLALYRKGGCIVGINSLLYDTRACAKMLAHLGTAFDAGDLPPPEAPDEVPFASAVDTYHRANRGPLEKVVFTMGAAPGEPRA
jgi:NADPH:quinone reductase-like Zn-dependent oxidoreductase